ncbi:MAG: hypothetical protein KDA61_05085, partial [Planctomycetales bacterium]|nr:hypothetical protein [Planctomycetales bacterium]
TLRLRIERLPDHENHFQFVIWRKEAASDVLRLPVDIALKSDHDAFVAGAINRSIDVDSIALQPASSLAETTQATIVLKANDEPMTLHFQRLDDSDAFGVLVE